MPPLSAQTTVKGHHLIMGEVDDFGQIDLAKRAAGTLRKAAVRVREMSVMGLNTTIDVTMDTNQFEEPPVFTIELSQQGPRVFVHGIAGELAVTITVFDDGSIDIIRH